MKKQKLEDIIDNCIEGLQENIKNFENFKKEIDEITENMPEPEDYKNEPDPDIEDLPF